MSDENMTMGREEWLAFSDAMRKAGRATVVESTPEQILEFQRVRLESTAETMRALRAQVRALGGEPVR